MRKFTFSKLKIYKGIANSLPVRALLAVMIIACLAIITAISSGVLAWIAESDAKAINTAGSIRMATYRINYLMANKYQNLNSLDQNFHVKKDQPIVPQLAEDMQARLNSLKQYEQFQGNQDKNITAQITRIQSMWAQRLQPLLLANNSQQFFLVSTHYINSVDELVKQIQARNEQRQSYQQALQMSSLVLTIIIMMVGLYELQQNVLIPVRQLRRATHQFRQGKYTQVYLSGYEEFNDLGQSFNDMAQALTAYKDNLEAEVTRKTYHLTQSNQALTLLYGFAKELSSQSISYPKLSSFIHQFAQVMPHLHLTLCLNNSQYQTKDVMTFTSESMGTAGSFCQQAHCDNCHAKQEGKTWIFPIQSQQTQWGELIVTPKTASIDTEYRHFQIDDHQVKQPTTQKINLAQLHDDEPSFDETELLKTLANLISIVFTSQKQREQEHKLILFEERNTIARELHDSLAQSLSYLKIQIAMLATLLKQSNTQDNPQERIEQIMSQTKEGLNDAYSQLRELLVTFRLKIEEGDFDTALKQACEEFAQKGGFNIHLENRINSTNLTANEQVDLLQISREALSNINRHAKAQNVHVILTQNQQGLVSLRLQDDGIGLSKNFDSRQHHGLKIMQERSNNLGGEFRIDNVLPHGTAILVKFTPKLFETLNQSTTDSLIQSPTNSLKEET